MCCQETFCAEDASVEGSETRCCDTEGEYDGACWAKETGAEVLRSDELNWFGEGGRGMGRRGATRATVSEEFIRARGRTAKYPMFAAR